MVSKLVINDNDTLTSLRWVRENGWIEYHWRCTILLQLQQVFNGTEVHDFNCWSPIGCGSGEQRVSKLLPFSHSVSRSIRNMYSIHQELCPMSRSYAKILWTIIASVSLTIFSTIYRVSHRSINTPVTVDTTTDPASTYEAFQLPLTRRLTNQLESCAFTLVLFNFYTTSQKA